jgi:hypothetical protein
MDKVLELEKSGSNNKLMRITVENKEERKRIHEYCEDNGLICRTIYKGKIEWKCTHCGYWQGPNTTLKLCNEYDDISTLLGYNPPQSATLSYSDSYFYCIHCDEHNSYSNNHDDLFEYRKMGRLKLVNYKSTGVLIIIKRLYPIPPYKANLHWDESFKAKRKYKV